MLVLSLHPGDYVRVTLPDGREAWLKIKKATKNNLQVCFDFPQDVAIVRNAALPFKEQRSQE